MRWSLERSQADELPSAIHRDTTPAADVAVIAPTAVVEQSFTPARTVDVAPGPSASARGNDGPVEGIGEGGQVSPSATAGPRDNGTDGPPSFGSLWELAVAVNRSEPAALAVASNGATATIPIDGVEVRRLLGTMWFRTVVPRMSQEWRTRILDVFVDNVVMPNHVVKAGRQPVRLGDLPVPATAGTGGDITRTRHHVRGR